MRSVYVASALENAATARAVAEYFVRCGWDWTYDWTGHGSVQLLGPARIAQVARSEADGVVAAGCVVALLPGGRGTHAEIGIGIGARKPVLVVAANRGDLCDAGGRECAFYHHSLVHRLVLNTTTMAIALERGLASLIEEQARTWMDLVTSRER